jgi:hypothetical protein
MLEVIAYARLKREIEHKEKGERAPRKPIK